MGKLSNLRGKFKWVRDPYNTVEKNSDEIFLGGLLMYKENTNGILHEGSGSDLVFQKKIDII